VVALLSVLVWPTTAVAEPGLPFSSECSRYQSQQVNDSLSRLRGQPVPKSALSVPKDCVPSPPRSEQSPRRDATSPPQSSYTPPLRPPTQPQAPAVSVYAPTPVRTREPLRPERPIPEAEASGQLRGVLERVGEPNATCHRKQYGGGWVTVCE
jgi:hypothetical protein